MTNASVTDRILNHGFGLILAIWHCLKSRHSLSVKILLIYHFLRLNLKFILLGKLLRLKKERFFGCTVTGFSYYHLKYLFEEIFFKNEYRVSCSHDRPVIFDCGANIGMATLFFKWIYPHSTVYSFEPDPATFELLKKNVADNKLKNVTCLTRP